MADEPEMTAPPTGNVVVQAWLVLVLAVVFGGGLAALELGLAPIIAENKRRATLDRIPILVPGAEAQASEPHEIAGRRVYAAHGGDGALLGWVAPGAGPGYADTIEVLVGLDPSAETVTGIGVLTQKETPGLGDFIQQDPAFASQFAGKSTATPIGVHKTNPGPQEIRALTGATISSQAVADIVNRVVREVGPEVRRLAQEPSP